MSRKKAATRKTPAAVETSISIALQTEEFLKNGGEVKIIPRGVSGKEQEPVAGRKHITYAKKS
jgi:hypothetical protein